METKSGQVPYELPLCQIFNENRTAGFMGAGMTNAKMS